MAVVYTAWPTGAQVIDFLAKANLKPALLQASDDAMTMRLNAVAALIEQKAKRNFLQTASGVLRRFDGSGVQEQEVDDYVDVTKIEIVQFGAVQGLEVTDFLEHKAEHYPKTRIYMRQGTRPFWGNFFLDRFPEGYANIEVTGTWGYGAEIPQDVWFANLLLVATSIMDMEGIQPQGSVLNWKEGDVSETFYPRPPSDAAGWEKFAWNTIMLHTESFGRKLRKRRAKFY